MKITTEDCRQFLAKNAEVQQIVSERCDAAWLLEDKERLASERTRKMVKLMERLVKDGANPDKWKRTRMYRVGSVTDLDRCDYARNPARAGGTVREFWLKDSDHISVTLLELDGQLTFLEDMSD